MRQPNPAKTLADLPPGAKIILLGEDVHASVRGDDEDEDDSHHEIAVVITSRDVGEKSLYQVRYTGDPLAYAWARGNSNWAGADYEIGWLGAEHGWGPLATDILMERATELGGSLSAGDPNEFGMKVADYYETRGDVEHVGGGAYTKKPKLLVQLAKMPNVVYEGDWQRPPVRAKSKRRPNPAVADHPPSRASLMAWLRKVVPVFVHAWIIEARTFKVCSSISPDFAVFAWHHGFPIVVAREPGHQFNVAITSDGLLRVDLSAVQFEVCRPSLRDFSPDERDTTEYQETKAIWERVKADPWSAARIEPFPAQLDAHLRTALDEVRKLAANYQPESDPRTRFAHAERWASLEAGGRLPNPHAPGRWFHGTTLEAAKKILADGYITAPKVLAEHYKGSKSLTPVEGLVYLTNDIELGLEYAKMRAYKGRGKFGVGALVEVEPQERCQPDEDEIGAALDFVLHDEPVGLAKGRLFYGALGAVRSVVGHMVLAHAPPALVAKWRRLGISRDAFDAPKAWSISRKASVGKAALAALPPDILDDIAMRSRSVGCSGARVLRAWRVDPDYWKVRNLLYDEERSKLPECPQGVDRAPFFAARVRAHERLIDEHLPPLAVPK